MSRKDKVHPASTRKGISRQKPSPTQEKKHGASGFLSGNQSALKSGRWLPPHAGSLKPAAWCRRPAERLRSRAGNGANKLRGAFEVDSKATSVLPKALSGSTEIINLTSYFTQPGPHPLLDLERSRKVDLGRCRFLGPIRSLRLEGKGFRRAKLGL